MDERSIFKYAYAVDSTGRIGGSDGTDLITGKRAEAETVNEVLFP
jgi:hypothetical protein